MTDKIVKPEVIDYLCATDPIFQQINLLCGPPPEWERSQGFETLCRIILEQQVSLESARAAYLKLKSNAREFTPSSILKLTDEQMRSSYVSRQKTKYLRALASAVEVEKLDLAKLSDLDPVTVEERLTSVTGIGTWTAAIYMMFCLKSPDLFPDGDIALINSVKELKGVSTKDEAVAASAIWQPYRTCASYFLWHYYLKKRGRQPLI